MPDLLDVSAVQLPVSCGRRCNTCGARTVLVVSAASDGVVELGHELPVGRACGGEVLVSFLELEPQVDDLLLKVAVLLGEAAGIGGDAEPGLMPGLLAERFGQAVFELPYAAGEPERALVGGGQVGLQRSVGDARPAGLAVCGRGGLEGVDLGEQVVVPVKEAAVDSGFSELKMIIDIGRVRGVSRTRAGSR